MLNYFDKTRAHEAENPGSENTERKWETVFLIWVKGPFNIVNTNNSVTTQYNDNSSTNSSKSPRALLISGKEKVLLFCWWVFAGEAACVVLQDDFMPSLGVLIMPGCWRAWRAFQIVSALGLSGRSQTAERETRLRSQEDTLAAGQN